MNDFAVRILGPVVHRPLDRPPAPVTGKLAAMLTTLVLYANRTVAVDVLVEALWEADPPRSAVANLRTYAHTLRAAFGPGPVALDSRHGGYVLSVPTGDCDYLHFGDLVARGGAALARGEALAAVEILERAHDVWRSDRAALGVPRSGPLAGWLNAVDDERLRTAEHLAEARIAVGEARIAARELGMLLAVAPLRDRAWRLKLLAHHRLGEHDAVAATYQAATSVFRDELGLDPDPRLTLLYRSLIAWEEPPAVCFTGP